MISSATDELYAILKHELTMIAGEAHVFRELYGPNPARIDLMNRTLPAVLRVFQDSLREAIVLGLSRLGDPAQTGRRDNLTFQTLIAAVTQDGEASLADKMNARAEEFDAAADLLRHWRNKVIAHTDRDVRERRVTLDALGLTQIEAALYAAGEVLNAFGQARSRTTTAYRHVALTNDHPFELLRRLRESEEYRREHAADWMHLRVD